ncbi:MAG: YebC/PmpR family DNA-binding transcriptional regulator [Parachlamydiales bacterium]
MAGHSKWANIKHKKERADAKRGKVFTRLTKEIISAVKAGGPDPDTNPRLRLAVQKAKAANLPNENIERNIKKASSADTAGYEDMLYELYGYGGVGLMVEGMTDNKNRLASEMRIATNKRGGSIATPGAVAFNFERKGVILVTREGLEGDDLFLLVSDAGADEFEEEGEQFMVLTPPDSLYAVKEAIEGGGGKVVEAELRYVPNVLVPCSEEDRQSNLALIEWLEGLDDVDEVTHNMDEP